MYNIQNLSVYYYFERKGYLVKERANVQMLERAILVRSRLVIERVEHDGRHVGGRKPVAISKYTTAGALLDHVRPVPREKQRHLAIRIPQLGVWQACIMIALPQILQKCSCFVWSKTKRSSYSLVDHGMYCFCICGDTCMRMIRS